MLFPSTTPWFSNQDQPTSHEFAIPVMNPVMDSETSMTGRTYIAKDLQSTSQLGVTIFFFDSLGILHLPLLGRAACRGKANISLNIPVVQTDQDVRACLENYPD